MPDLLLVKEKTDPLLKETLRCLNPEICYRPLGRGADPKTTAMLTLLWLGVSCAGPESQLALKGCYDQRREGGRERSELGSG